MSRAAGLRPAPAHCGRQSATLGPHPLRTMARSRTPTSRRRGWRECRRVRPRPGARCGEGEPDSRAAPLVIRLVALEVALHPRGVQQLLDALGLVEPLVDAEADVRREF